MWNISVVDESWSKYFRSDSALPEEYNNSSMTNIRLSVIYQSHIAPAPDCLSWKKYPTIYVFTEVIENLTWPKWSLAVRVERYRVSTLHFQSNIQWHRHFRLCANLNFSHRRASQSCSVIRYSNFKFSPVQEKRINRKGGDEMPDAFRFI